MKKIKVFLAAFTVLIVSGLTQINAQSVIHWQDVPWSDPFYVECPNSDVTTLYGTLCQDFVIHTDKDGNWIKINGQYDKSKYIANTGEVFTVFGAVTIGFTNPNCFNETLHMFGERGTKITIRTNIRFHEGKLVRDVITTHCNK